MSTREGTIATEARANGAGRRCWYLTSAACLTLLLALTRWWSHATLLLNSDAVNYVRALTTFDLANYSPHPPGYILFVLAARAVSLLVADANSVYLVVNFVAQAIVLLLTLLFLSRLLSPVSAFLGSLVVLFHPLFWYYGSMTSVYSAEAATIMIVACVADRYDRSPTALAAAVLGVVWALAGGVRQFTIPFTAPAIAYVLWRRRSLAEFWCFAAGSIFGALAWSVPLIVMSGGWAKYRAISSEFFGYYLQNKSPVFSLNVRGVFYSIIHWVTAMAQLLWPLAPFLLLIRRLPTHEPQVVRHTRYVRLFWFLLILPPVAFYLFIYIGQSGYVLALLAPILILLAGWMRPATARGLRRLSFAFAASALLGVLAFSVVQVPGSTYVTAPNPRFYFDPRNWKTVAAKLLKYQADFSRAGIRKGEGLTRGYLAQLGSLPPDSTIAVYIRDREVGALLWEYYSDSNTILYRRWPANNWVCRGPSSDGVILRADRDSLVEATVSDQVRYIFVIDYEPTDYIEHRRRSPELDKWGKSPAIFGRNSDWEGDGLRIRRVKAEK